MGINHNRLVIQEIVIAKSLNVDPATVSRDISYLAAQSQNYLNDLAKSTLPFMYQTSIEGYSQRYETMLEYL